jgi:sortase A
MYRWPGFDNWRGALALCLLCLGLQQLGGAAYIHAKAQLAQVLIGWAWSESRVSGGLPVKPWPWADTWPVARLEVPGRSPDLYILAGASGHALAFGPGLEVASARPGQPGLSVIGGHRDTHFAFLQGIKTNSHFFLHLPDGESITYRVTGARIVDITREPRPLSAGVGSELQLVTCYPFDALLPGGSLRYVVSARVQLSVDQTPFRAPLIG